MIPLLRQEATKKMKPTQIGPRALAAKGNQRLYVRTSVTAGKLASNRNQTVAR
jgi:hypothetical protein